MRAAFSLPGEIDEKGDCFEESSLWENKYICDGMNSLIHLHQSPRKQNATNIFSVFLSVFNGEGRRTRNLLESCGILNAMENLFLFLESFCPFQYVFAALELDYEQKAEEISNIAYHLD